MLVGRVALDRGGLTPARAHPPIQRGDLGDLLLYLRHGGGGLAIPQRGEPRPGPLEIALCLGGVHPVPDAAVDPPHS